jgi:hypothetical protein
VSELKATLARVGDPGLTDRLAQLESTVADLTGERDSLQEDIVGWRTRCADLERAVEAHRSKLDEERRENMVAREKVRKLGDLLAEREGTGAAELAEMREQIFRMANELEKERGLRERIEARLAASESRREEESSAAALSASLSTADFFSHHDNYDSTSTKPSSPPSLRSSFGKSSSPMPYDLPPPGHLSLQPLPEEEEECGEFEDGGVPQLSAGGQSGADSDNDPRSQRQSPATPPPATSLQAREGVQQQQQQPEERAGGGGGGRSHHGREGSFVKEWTMPKGPVEPQMVRIVDNTDDVGDSSFFQLCPNEILPPLPLCDSTISIAASFDELVCDEAYHARHPSSPRPTPERISSSSSSRSFGSGTKFGSGSVHDYDDNSNNNVHNYRTSVSSSRGSFSSSVQRSSSLVSFQNLGTMFGLYGGGGPASSAQSSPPPTTSAVIAASSNNTSGRYFYRPDSVDSSSQWDTRPRGDNWFSSTSSSHSSKFGGGGGRTRSHTIAKQDQPRPRYSSLTRLDFTAAVGVRPEHVLRI